MSVTPVQMYRTPDGKLFDTEAAAVRHRDACDLAQLMLDVGDDRGDLDLHRVAEYLVDNFNMEKRA